MEEHILDKEEFSWIPFYKEFADRLLKYRDDRQTLLKLLDEAFEESNMNNPFAKSEQTFEDTDPFSVFATFNRGISDENRIRLAESIGKRIGVTTAVPTQFTGIPKLNNMGSMFFRFEKTETEKDINNQWNLFEDALSYADQNNEENHDDFIESYEKVRKIPYVKWKMTIGLFWIRPYFYLNLDANNRRYLNKDEFSFIKQITTLQDVPTGKEYIELIQKLQNYFEQDNIPYNNFPEFSQHTWVESISTLEVDDHDYTTMNNINDQNKRKYWIYTPGKSSSMWDEFYNEGIMGLRRGEMGDLTQYASKEEMKQQMKQLYGDEYTYINVAHAAWQFVNEIQPGDIIFAKKGLSIIIGYGVVESEYIFDADKEIYKHVRKVDWKKKGEWSHPGRAVAKSLTEITPYTEYVEKLKRIFLADNNEEDEEVLDELDELEETYEEFTSQNFLNQVFMDRPEYERLVKILKMKKNLILQGAPGVGKTFAAKRLAYSIMNEQDSSRVKMIQFHQSYSYEDFMMGYRPVEDGFKLEEGPFYEFCKKAEKDSEREYFFIIDEINRGNLSQIFGELLMLLENDKRGHELQLIYSNEMFSIPKNVYVIGMMNTADRSLAMIDYALRRRFAFFHMKPGFNSEGFQQVIRKANNPKFNKLITQIQRLNEVITEDETLGEGFEIGHSYVCFNDVVTDEDLSVVIEYELLPLLEEYWFDELEKYNEWSQKFYGVLND
ncbi:McrB family protein [Sporosarcina jiandibaonis]|uniref:McrB family protein n=1 Tax=Sporosarcina jiandibaonis TaxID=2715535 RepID=UPI001557BDC8|nr:AAA family ATPase [Sporosarcina jiandibaonis]